MLIGLYSLQSAVNIQKTIFPQLLAVKYVQKNVWFEAMFFQIFQ